MPLKNLLLGNIYINTLMCKNSLLAMILNKYINDYWFIKGEKNVLISLAKTSNMFIKKKNSFNDNNSSHKKSGNNDVLCKRKKKRPTLTIKEY